MKIKIKNVTDIDKRQSHQDQEQAKLQKKENRRKTVSKCVWGLRNLLPMILFPIITFYLLELYINNPWEKIKVPIHFLNFYLFELIMLLLFMICGRLKAALMIQTGFFMVVGLANFYVLQFRAAPIMPWDIFSIGTAASVANNFQYTLERDTILVILGFILLLVMEFFIPNWKLEKKGKIRIAGSLISFGLLWNFTYYMHQDSTISKYRMYDKLFTPTVVSRRNGSALAFVMELKYLTVDKPDHYSAANAEELLAPYQTDTAADVSSKPNIIVIMNEAFSDPAILGDFETNEDYMPFMHSLLEGAEDTVSGYLNVSVLGGNTANTEFEYLTGNSMAFLPQGSIPYQQYIKGETASIASYLKEYGYRTIGMHPYNSSGWDRDTAYPFLGFDETYFIKDWDQPKLIRKYISDESDYDKIIDLFEQKEAGTPFFLFNVTMQNHSSYTDEYDNFHPDIEVQDADSQVLNNYLSLMKISDEALEDLITYFKQVDEDTVIVFFGDHQPTDSVVEAVWKLNGTKGSALTQEQLNNRYKVPYIIWANYDIEEATQQDTSANFLAASTLDIAGIPKNTYFNYLSSLKASYPVISAIRAEDAAGNSNDIKDSKEALNDYQILQYYDLFGKN